MNKLVLFLLTLILLTVTNKLHAQGTAFTYQGQLIAGGGAASGNYDFTFALYNNSATNTGQVGGTLTNLAVGVTNGLFTVTLDFGANFPGANRWLAIGVRTNGGASFTALSPLQPLTPTPYAIYAPNAGAATSASSVAASNISGTIPLTQLPGTVLTNAETNVTLSGTFTGNGGGLTNLAGWQLAGNAGTTSNNFLGTTDNQSLQIRVGGVRAGLITPSNGGPDIVFGAVQNVISNGASSASILGGSNNVMGASSSFSMIGGGQQNSLLPNNAVLVGGQLNAIGSGANNAVLVGGTSSSIGSSALQAVLVGGANNVIQASASSSFLGGGSQNIIGTSSLDSTLGGGVLNSVLDQTAFLGGGQQNSIKTGGQGAVLGGGNQNNTQAIYSFLGGGQQNNISNTAMYSVLGGGQSNTVSGARATVPGGASNLAGGQFSFAAGANAQATNSGAFVWADAEGTPFVSTNANSFNVRANGGARLVTGGAGLSVDGSPVLAGNNGSGLTNLNASQLTGGTVPLAQLPAAVVTNNETNVTLGNLTLGGNLNLPLTASIFSGINPLLYTDTKANFFVGPNAGNSTVTGQDNTAIGSGALEGNISGNNNTATGAGALQDNLGGNNTADGAAALGTSTTGSNDVAIGVSTLALNTSGSESVAIGVSALSVNISGDKNVAVGFSALQSLGENTEAGGTNNIALGYQAGINFNGDESGNIDIGNPGTPGDTNIIRIGVSQTATYLVGTVNIPILHITGGADLAEPFRISAAGRKISEGAVVVIDDANPGQLKMSDQPYDSHVAGVISGANGVHPGIQMQQQGLLEGGRNVALTGRVYVQADASNGAIKPGDLLTTSSTPGRAMKVSDHLKAQGAILGKAMTGLKTGQGMVLVLVTLQ